MRRNLKRFFKNNPVAYKAWFLINKNRLSSNIKLPHKKDDYYFDGYPRSGNTFLRGLLNYITPEQKGAHHLHVTAGIKLAQSSNVNPIFILIRNPKDAILSNLYRKFHHSDTSVQNVNINVTLSELINDWLVYYQYISKQTDIHLIHFEKAVNHTEETIREILKLLNDDKSIINLEKIIEEYNELMRKKEATKETAARSLPNDKRNEFKQRYTSVIENFESFKEANKLYQTLSE